jgi:hypothetical protein
MPACEIPSVTRSLVHAPHPLIGRSGKQRRRYGTHTVSSAWVSSCSNLIAEPHRTTVPRAIFGRLPSVIGRTAWLTPKIDNNADSVLPLHRVGRIARCCYARAGVSRAGPSRFAIFAGRRRAQPTPSPISSSTMPAAAREPAGVAVHGFQRAAAATARRLTVYEGGNSANDAR